MKTRFYSFLKYQCITILFIATAIACNKKEDDTNNPPSNNPPANIVGYNCVNGNCSGVSSNANYTTLSECQSDCGTAGTAGYDCVSGTCVNVGSNATYGTLTECENVCGVDPCDGSITSITDSRDGQVYNIVQIGSQTWFAENLRYAGGIEHVIVNAEWSSSTPVWGHINNDAANDAVYGKLYNKAAVNTGSLCPAGWHIPTDAEWSIMITHLDPNTDPDANTAEFAKVHSSTAGRMMKAHYGWDSPTLGPTYNQSCFTAIAAGGRNGMTGASEFLGGKASWWSSTANWGRGINNGNSAIQRNYYYERNGLSCRCVQD